MTWFPISEAPTKNNDDVWLKVEGKEVKGWWSNFRQGWLTYETCATQTTVNPTHWRPLHANNTSSSSFST